MVRITTNQGTAMRLNNIFEIETFDPGPDWSLENFHQFVSQIKSECSESLAGMQKAGVLWRGSKAGAQPGQRMPDWPGVGLFDSTNRKRLPRDTNPGAHDLIVDMQRRAGWKVDRETCYFAISRDKTAQIYGTPGMVFPLNGSHYSWNTKARDQIYYNYANVVTRMTNDQPESFDLSELYSLYKRIFDWYLYHAVDSKAYKALIDQVQSTMNNIDSTGSKSDSMLERFEMLTVDCEKIMTYIEDPKVQHDNSSMEMRVGLLGEMIKMIHTLSKLFVQNMTIIRNHPAQALDMLGWKVGGPNDWAQAIDSHNELMINGRYYFVETKRTTVDIDGKRLKIGEALTNHFGFPAYVERPNDES